ncbi:MAG: ABC transporter permease [Spirochaetaceae bacterium]|nr:MAG: ABC transporter permease [Spirochaetaceae bacterium]
MRVAASLLIAMRYLFGVGLGKGARIRSAVLIVALSLVPLVVVLQVADGMIAGITARFIETGTYHGQVLLSSRLSSAEIHELRRVALDVPGVTTISVERQGLGLLQTPAGRSGVTVRAVSPELYSEDLGFAEYVEVREGAFDLQEANSIVIGVDLASRFDLSVGDNVRIVTVRPSPSGGFLPRPASFVVKGIVATGYQELDRLWVFIPFERGLALLSEGVANQILGVKVEEPFAIQNPLYSPNAVFHGVSSLMGFETESASSTALSEIRSRLGAGVRVFSWYQLEQSRYISFQTTKNLLIFIMFLIVCVAAVNVSSALVLMVLEKEHEIAILKSTGASPRGIILIFLFAGFVSGVFGAILGMAIGILAAVNINTVLRLIEQAVNGVLYATGFLAAPFVGRSFGSVELLTAEFYLEEIPIVLQPAELILAAVLTILLSTLASYFPARRAGAIRPIEVIRRH